ncbi:MAG: NUDIX domain-containing protein [bacterium]|nr:NUDIX domain-containing protein [bacterium]
MKPAPKLQQHAHCSYCGSAFHPDVEWPRTCRACGNTTYRNPLPVAVVIQPVGTGVIVIRRGIEPQRGGLALPGGYVNDGEDWRSAAARELHEETGIRIANPGSIKPFAVESAPDGSLVLLFGLAPPIAPSDLPRFRPSDEATERLIVDQPTELAFPLHTAMLQRYFRMRACVDSSSSRIEIIEPAHA